MGSLLDLTGQRFGSWLVLERTEGPGHNSYWRVRCCDCRAESRATAYRLLKGTSTPCRACNTKPCKICGELTDSKYAVCRRTPACRQASDKAWRSDDIEAYRERVREGNRVRAQAYRERNPEKEHAKGKRWRDANPEMVAAKGARWRAANADRAREQARAWAKQNPARRAAVQHRRRAKKQSVPSIPVRVARLILAVQQAYTCPLCWGLLTGPLHKLHLDHIIPLSLGGWDVPGNWGLTHPRCNLRKGNRVDLESPACKSAHKRMTDFVVNHPELIIFPENWEG